jgi:hypothetical protein
LTEAKASASRARRGEADVSEAPRVENASAL